MSLISTVLFAVAQGGTPGVTAMFWQCEQPFQGIPKLIEGQVPNAYFVQPTLQFNSEIKTDNGTLNQNVYGEISASVRVATAATYDFEVRTTAFARLTVSGEFVLSTLDKTFVVSPGVARGQYRLPVGKASLKLNLMQNSGPISLDVRWKKSTESVYRAIDPGLLTTEAGQTFVVSPGPKKASLGEPKTRPGDRRPLEAVHPGFKLERFRGPEFRPAVGGMAFLPDGRLAICTWDERGAVYFIKFMGKDRSSVSLFAEGLGEPLGLAYYQGDLYVTQKGEVTRLRDTDNDGKADEFLAVSTGWGVSPNYHEFTFNLVPFGEKFYISSSIPLRGGQTNYTPTLTGSEPAYSTPNGPGMVYRIDPKTGLFEPIATGLRTPNGMNIGVDGQLFVADNQGSWLPSSPLYVVRPGDVFLHQTQPTGKPDVSKVSVWFPHGEIGNSPAQMVLVPDGPYRGQMLIGDVTHGGIKRVQLEKVGKLYQGAVYRHSQGLEAGVNRLIWGPDGCLYVGGIGSNGNWNHKGHKFGLERLRPTKVVPFEIHEIVSLPNGFEIRFTHPIAATSAEVSKRLTVKTWKYAPTVAYGGPKIDEKTLTHDSVLVSKDGKAVTIRLSSLEAGSVVYFNFGDLLSANGEIMWSPEAWYTLQALPKTESPAVRKPLVSAAPKGAEILIDSVGNHKMVSANKNIAWKKVFDGLQVVHDPAANIGGTDHFSPNPHGDAYVHLEWLSPPGGNPQAQTNGNSGIKLQGLYEIQIMNLPGITDRAGAPTKFNESGSVYRQTAPLSNPSYGAGVWQTYDIWFSAPKWQGGKKVANARMTLYWNGVLVQKDVEVPNKTGLSSAESPGAHPLLLQDHKNEAEQMVKFRNLWILHNPELVGFRPPN
jgi:hypothetical protein